MPCAKPMPSDRRRFNGHPDQVVLARQFVVSVLAEDSAIREVARLLVSEVTTNALRHTASGTAGGGFRVSYELREDRLRVEVMTPVRAPPHSAERTTWRRPAVAGWNCWTRWPVGGGSWEARRGGWSGSSWTSAQAKAGHITPPVLNVTAEAWTATSPCSLLIPACVPGEPGTASHRG